MLINKGLIKGRKGPPFVYSATFIMGLTGHKSQLDQGLVLPERSFCEKSPLYNNIYV